MKRYKIEGPFWCVGPDIYIDTYNDKDGWKTICLNDLIKNNIKENSKLTITIDVEERKS